MKIAPFNRMLKINRSQVGNAEILRVTEQIAKLPTAQLFPDHQDELATIDLPNTIAVSIHRWVVRTPQRLIVVDTATGNHRDRDGNPLFHNLQTQYAKRLAAAGVDRRAVDTVLMTHLHTDHVGWNTYCEDGHWLPMFPSARFFLLPNSITGSATQHAPRLWKTVFSPYLMLGLPRPLIRRPGQHSTNC